MTKCIFTFQLYENQRNAYLGRVCQPTEIPSTSKGPNYCIFSTESLIEPYHGPVQYCTDTDVTQTDIIQSNLNTTK